MKNKQDIMNSYRKGDPYQRLDIFFMYRYFRNEFTEIEHREIAGRKFRWKAPEPDKLQHRFESMDNNSRRRSDAFTAGRLSG
ncbi:hypothetical protein [Desulfospira joergensenii]|uniref:hypothetical protein n=1 Tax=Desulfospira joergensenii TaxID=53329 RepID=UPI0003B360BF|nr:hypothetical protein [Desulfospira joergensenii]